MFGFKSKGSIAEGMDADITVVDMDRYIPLMTVAGGRIVMKKGKVAGKGGTVIITGRAEDYFKAQNIPYDIAHVDEGELYR
jgi:adenine deaminase